MSLSRSWQFIGPVGWPMYRIYDWLRRGVNRRLVRFLGASWPDAPVEDSAPPAWHVQPLVVLESGSGTAFASSVLAGRPDVGRTICLDIDPDALREAVRRDSRLLAVVGDLRRMPFADACMDVVFNSSTVEHLDRPIEAVREMRRVCADRGRVFVGVPYAAGPLAFQPLVRGTRVGVWLGPVFTRSSLDGMLRSAGLTPVRHLRYFWRFFIGAVAVKNTSSDGAWGQGSC